MLFDIASYRISKWGRLILVALCFLTMSAASYATHVMGSDISYECLSKWRYKVTLKAYRDCRGNPLLTSQDIDVDCNTSSWSTSYSLTYQGRRDITGLDSKCVTKSRCAGGSFAYGVQEYTFTTIIDLTSVSCKEFTISWAECCRNNNITTGAANADFYTEATLRTDISKCNSSPVFSTPATVLICRNNDFVFNNGAIDTIDQGDSLSYKLVDPLSAKSTTIPYTGQFSATKPLTFLGFPNTNLNAPAGFRLDPVTGDLSFRPTVTNQVSVMVLEVAEWRKDTLGVMRIIGKTRRDLQIIVISCNNNNPVILGKSDTTCPGEKVIIDIKTTDANSSDSVELSWNKGIPKGKFTISNGKAQFDSARFEWTPKLSDVSNVPHTFTVTAKDDACPFPGQGIRAFTIFVYDKPQAVTSNLSLGCGHVKVGFTPNRYYDDLKQLWTVRDSMGNVVSTSPRQYDTLLVSKGKIIVSLELTALGGCSTIYYDTLEIPEHVEVHVETNDTFTCEYTAINITTSTVDGVQPFKYVWNTSPNDTLTTLTLDTAKGNKYWVTITDAIGCTWWDTVRVRWNDKPHADFTTDALCEKNDVVFNNITQYPNIKTLKFDWDFGDNETSTNRTPVHNYKTVDTLNVKLKAFILKGCSDSIIKQLIVRPIPQAQFTVNDSIQCFNENKFILTNQTTVDYGTLEYKWLLGNGDSSVSEDTSYKYKAIGQYVTKLFATTTYNCKDSFERKFTVNRNPIAKFTVNDTGQCLNGNQFNYTNNSSIPQGSMSYKWHFGDGQSSTAISPNHTYNNQNTYKTWLVSTSNLQCSDSISKQVITFPKPNPSFTIDDSSQCLKANDFKFTNTSAIDYGTMTHKWLLGDGKTSTSLHTQNVYTKAGPFAVRLVETSNFSCTDSIEKKLEVRPQPNVQFTINDSGQCVNNNSFVFTNNSSVKYGTMKYYWDFANGKNCNCTDTTISYTYDSTYRVVLQTITNFGCEDTAGKYVLVHSKPTLSFIVNDSSQCVNDNLFSFTNTSTIKQGTQTFYWDFGNGDTSTLTNPDNVYSIDTTYTAWLKATSNLNCIDSTSKQMRVFPKPHAGFTENDSSQCLNTNQFIFNNTSKIKSGTLSYTWNFGNGEISTQIDTSIVFQKDTNFWVTLIPLSSEGCFDTLTRLMTIYPLPKPRFAVNDSGQCLNTNQYVFGNTTTIKYGTFTHEWWLGGEGASTQISPVFTFSNDISYVVKLKETSNQGCTDSTERIVTVYPVPKVDFSINDTAQCVNTDLYSFTNGSSIKYGTMQHVWLMGNGDSLIGTNANYGYDIDGKYTTTLKTTSNYGCIDSLRKNITVIPKPVAAFGIDKDDQCVDPGIFIFTNQSTIKYSTPLTYTWDFDNGVKTTTDDTTVAYMVNGEYYPTLITKTGDNCYDTFTRRILVYPKPTANFTINKDTQCVEINNFIFTNTTTIDSGALDYQWFYDDGINSALPNGQNIYSNDGVYTVKLVSQSDFGCLDTVIKNVYVQPKPEIDFIINDSGQCVNNNLFVFTNQSSIKFGTLTYEWNFANGDNCNCKDTAIRYFYDSTFRVVLKATSNLGCIDTAGRYVVVHSKPTPAYIVNDSNQCFETQQFDFTNTSTIKEGTLTQTWSFSDGQTASTITPTFKYNNPGFYQLELVLTSNFNCKDSITGGIEVYKHPNPNFIGLADLFCTDYPSGSLVPTVPGGIFVGGNVIGNEYVPTGVLGNDSVTYTVEVNGCFSDTTKYTIVHPLPTLNIGPDTTLCKNEPKFFDVSFPNSTYLWQDGSRTPNYKVKQPGLYKVTLYNICDTLTDEINISYLDYDCNFYFPTSFTPNGDGLNDVFLPYFDDIIKIDFKVLDRWGGLIFSTKEIGKGWDGNFANGTPVPSGVYMWLIQAKFDELGETYTHADRGSITLLR